MATNFCDALQTFQGGTSGTSINNEGNIIIPDGSATLSDLIKLNFDFPVEPNIPIPESYNIYIYNNNDNGEIRFYTKDAKNNNDYNKDYFSGNYSEPRLNFNTKIGKDGKLYVWHNYTVQNPTKLSGWYDIDSSFNGVEGQLTLLDVLIGTLNVGQIALQSQLDTVITSTTTQFAVIDSVLAEHEVRLNFIEFSPIENMNIFDWDSTVYDANAIFSTTRRTLQQNMKKGGAGFSRLRQRTIAKNRTRLSSIITKIFSDSLTTIGIIGFTAGLYGVIREILDKKKAENYSDELLGIADNLSQLEVSQNNDTLNHLGLTIVSGNGGFPQSLPNKEYTVPIQRDAILKFGIDSSFNAYLITVEQYGETDFSVGETISINKNLINGGSGTLILTVSSLGTLKQWTELRQTYLQNKLNKINTKNRRKNYIVGHDDIDTNQFTNVDATYTDYDEESFETITYKVLKSRINLLPSGANDIDVYTSTGKIGIGTAIPSTKLHIYDDVANTTTLTIQNNFTGSGITASPTATTTGTTGNYTYQVFTYTTETGGTGSGQTLYTITAPAGGVVCDVLVVGGGGGGGKFGGGGGGGAVLFATNITLTSGSLRVGNGGAGATVNDTGVNGINGADSSITINSIQYIAKGGGGGGSRRPGALGKDGNAGGSGGGGSHANSGTQAQGGVSNKLTYSGFQSFGNAGGLGKLGISAPEPSHTSGGGGGAGSVGGNATGSGSGTGGGNGGAGIDYSSYFGTTVGHSGWFAGGGGGNTFLIAGVGGYGNGGNGLLGGGGQGGHDTNNPAVDGLANTGGGGGGGRYYDPNSKGGNGGSGIVIIRYLTPSSSSSIELVRGTTADGVVDYSVGNYDGDFKVKSVNAGTPTDRMIINSVGRVGIGTDPHGTHKLNVDGTIIATNFVGNYVGAGKLSTSVEVLAYKATDPTIRIESGASGTPILEFMRGVTQDVNKDYRLISQSDTFKLQYQDNITTYDNNANQLMWFDNDEAVLYKALECKSNVGIGTIATAPLHLYNTNNILRLQTVPVDGTNAIEFVRGSAVDPLTDFRLFTDTFGKFKIQYANNVLAYGATGSDLIELSPTNINIYKDTQVSGKVGIGTSAGTLLHTYHETENVLRIGTGTWGTSALELFVAREIGNLTNYRIISEIGDFKIQYNNNSLNYGDAGTDLFKINHADAVIYKKLESKFNIGIGTTPHATYKLDAVGTINATAFRGNGAEVTDLDAAKITTGQINLDRITLTAAKLYQNFDTTNFAVIDDKIDLPPNYSFTITGYDSQTLFNPSTDRKFKGKMSCSYDDRNGVHKLLTEENKTTNVAVLQYKVGDKITIRNTADPKEDYLLYDGFKYFNSLYLVKRPISQPVSWTNVAWQPHLFEWRSGDGLDGRPDAYIYKPGEIQVHTFTTPVSVVIETGFNYYLFKTYNEVDYDQYGTIFINASGYGDDFDDFNRAFGAGQTFKLQSGSGFINTEYIPTAYIAADISVASDRRVGVVKPRARVSVDASGNLDADIPTSTDLITNMNTSHFTNNLATGKIDFNTSLIPATPTSANLVNILNTTQFENNVGTSRVDIKSNWKPTTAGTADAVAWSGITNVPTTWNVSQIPDLGTAKITSGTFDVARIPDLGTAKITSGTFSTDRIPNLDTGKITTGTFDVARIPDLGTAKITSGTFDVARIPDLGTAKITSGTFDVARIPNLDTGKITTGTFVDARIPSLAISKTTGLQTALDGKASTSHTHIISDVSGLQTALDGKASTSHTHTIANVSGLQTALDGKAPTSHTHIISDVSGLQTALDGKAPTSHTHTIANVSGLQGALDAKQATLTAGTGISIVGSTINSLWRNPTVFTTFNSVHTTQRVRIGSTTEAEALLQLTGDATNGGTLRLEHIGNTPNIEIVRGNTASTNFNWNILNDNSFKLQSRNLTNAYATMFEISGAGDVGIGTVASTANKLDVNGSIKGTGIYTTFVQADTLLRAEELRVFGYGLTSVGTSTLMRISNNINNELRISQNYLAANDIRFNIFQTVNAVEYATPSMTFYQGRVGIGTTNPATYPLVVGGDVNITGAYRVNGVLFKPATSGNADTATALATSRNIAGTPFNGTADINIDYNALNNRPITVVPSTTNLQVSSTFNLIVGTVTGTIERLSVGGNIRATGNIVAETNLTATGTSTLTGRVGIGTTPHATHALDVNGTSRITGNTGIGTVPSTTHRVDVLGDVNVSGAFRVGGVAITGGSKWTTATDTTRIYYNTGNVGIGTTNPSTAKLVISGTGGAIGLDMSSTDQYAEMRVIRNSLGVGDKHLYIGFSSGTGSITRLYSNGFTETLRCESGNTNITGELRVQGNKLIINGTQPTIYFRDSDQRQGMIHINSGLMYFLSGPATGTSGGEDNWQVNSGDWPLILNLNNNDASFGGEITAYFYAVSNTNTDYLCIQTNLANLSSVAKLPIKAAFGSFTAFHRCYTDDDLYNNETDEDIDIFKNNYMGRVVIATGKIKTDFTRKKAREEVGEAEEDVVVEPVVEEEVIVEEVVGEADEPIPLYKPPIEEEDEWYSGIDKDGISVEDAVPIVRLSRQRKDKRVFGVFGGTKRSTNNKDRLIVNSVGEGAICVSNTNGNIENGDYIQSSDLLGYGEKQDDDLLHNYTIAKATIDCDFELDSPYYQCHEIENGVRVAFIACSYHCG